MKSLSMLPWEGDSHDVADAKKYFGDVRIDCNDSELRLILTHKLPNFYRDNNATVETAPLYIVMPTRLLAGVWPDDSLTGVKIGTPRVQRHRMTHAMGMHHDRAGLYLFLGPDMSKDIKALEVGNLGI